VEGVVRGVRGVDVDGYVDVVVDCVVCVDVADITDIIDIAYIVYVIYVTDIIDVANIVDDRGVREGVVRGEMTQVRVFSAFLSLVGEGGMHGVLGLTLNMRKGGREEPKIIPGGVTVVL
jgi:hypothetical protein